MFHTLCFSQNEWQGRLDRNCKQKLLGPLFQLRPFPPLCQPRHWNRLPTMFLHYTNQNLGGGEGLHGNKGSRMLFHGVHMKSNVPPTSMLCNLIHVNTILFFCTVPIKRWYGTPVLTKLEIANGRHVSLRGHHVRIWNELYVYKPTCVHTLYSVV